MSPRWWFLSVVASLGLAGACASDRPEPDRPASPVGAAPDPAAAAPVGKSSAPVGKPSAPVGKPSAPVALAIASRPLGGDAHEVTLTARVSRDVPTLELSIEGTRQVFGPVRAGAVETLTAQVRVDVGRGRDVVGAAATGAPTHRRTAAAVVRVGVAATAAAAPPTRTIVLPDGTEVMEVRP